MTFSIIFKNSLALFFLLCHIVAMKLAVIGSRRRFCPSLVQSEIAARNPSSLISGGAAGIDTQAEEAARSMNIPVVVIRPDKTGIKGRADVMAAIRRRNEVIIRTADAVLAFPSFDRTGGTERVICMAKRMSKPCFIVASNGQDMRP